MASGDIRTILKYLLGVFIIVLLTYFGTRKEQLQHYQRAVFLNSSNSTAAPITSPGLFVPTNSTAAPPTSSVFLNSTNSTTAPATPSVFLSSTNSTAAPATPSVFLNSTNSTRAPATPSVAPVTTTVITLSMTIAMDFDTSYAGNTEEFKIFSIRIQSEIDRSYQTVPGYIAGSAKVTNFRSGSIITDYTITATSNNLDLTSAHTLLVKNLWEAGIPVIENSFAESVETNLCNTTNKLYPLQSLKLTCKRPTYIEGEMKWIVNKINPVQDTTRYSIINSNSTLIVKNASESDSGRYSCIINRKTIPYIQWQDIVIEQRPYIELENKRVFECKDQVIPIKCCSALYSIEWDRIPSGDQVEISGSDCITLQHKLQKVNCGIEETFTCQLRNMDYLQDYNYSRKSIAIKTSVENFDCTAQTLGIGQIGDKVNGLCENGKTGYITYQCKVGGWQKTQDQCVPIVIDSLRKDAEVLTVEKVQVFMTNLSQATKKYDIDIIQSAATVKSIVDMLLKVAYVSQNMTIDKLVMNDYLKTVDIIVVDKSNNTWEELNNDNITANTSTGLLFAIETVADRLSRVNFTLNQSSIQLNRALIENSFNGTSQLHNLTTQIAIPNVPKPTFITFMVFSNLDKVLPTRNTSNNDSRSENHINGDVVVIRVDQTINNISLTFDMTNELLGNPQCVFWKFDFNRWDSTGCKVKLLGKQANQITCECNHTTSFSILMSPFAIDDKTLSYITYIGVAISMASLVLCLIIEMIIWKSVTGNDTSYMRHVSIVNMAVSLLIADIWFIIGAAIAKPGESTPVNPCSAAVFFIHFFYLALFFWTLTLALLLFYRTVMVLSQRSRTSMMVIAFTIGYCAPLLIAVITVASTARAGRYISTRDACWLNWFESKALLAFVIPALTIVAFNLLVLIVVVCKISGRSVKSASLPDEKHVLVVIARCVAILTPIFGLTWGFGVGTMVSNVYGLHVVFAILNSFQGFFVLVFGTLLDSKVQQSLAGKFKLNLSSDRTRSTSAAPSSSSRLGFFRRKWRYVYHVSNDTNPSPKTSS